MWGNQSVTKCTDFLYTLQSVMMLKKFTEGELIKNAKDDRFYV